MAWTAPVLRFTGDIITAAQWNEANYHGLRYLKGIDTAPDGTIVLEDDITFPGAQTVDGVDVSDHHALHENGAADEISVAALSGLLADDQHVLDAEVINVALALAGTGTMVGPVIVDNAVNSIESEDVAGATIGNKLRSGTGDWRLVNNAEATLVQYDITGKMAVGIVPFARVGLEYIEAWPAAHNAGGDGAWENWDINAIIPANTIWVDILAQNTAAGTRFPGVRKNGSGLQRKAGIGIESSVTFRVQADGGEIIEIYASVAADIDFFVVGWLVGTAA